MKTQFITLELPILQTPEANRKQAEAEIRKYGTLLRWAITQLNRDRQTFLLEALVVTM